MSEFLLRIVQSRQSGDSHAATDLDCRVRADILARLQAGRGNREAESTLGDAASPTEESRQYLRLAKVIPPLNETAARMGVVLP